jgi:TPR repeat protein
MIRLFEITLAAKIPNAESWAKPEPDLGRFHKAMRLRKTNPDFARSELQYLAGQGSRLSNLLLGNISEEDEPVNCSEAEIYYRKAAQQGSLAAFLFLGKLFLRQKRMDEAFAALSFAANKGYAPAMHWLGRVYLDGYDGLAEGKRHGKSRIGGQSNPRARELGANSKRHFPARYRGASDDSGTYSQRSKGRSF